MYEEYRTFCLMHMKKMEWFSKLSKEDKSHKAMMAKNKYKVGFDGLYIDWSPYKTDQRYTKYNTSYMRDQLMKIHEAYQAMRSLA